MTLLGYAAGALGMFFGILGSTLADHDLVMRGMFMMIIGIFFMVMERR